MQSKAAKAKVDFWFKKLYGQVMRNKEEDRQAIIVHQIATTWAMVQTLTESQVKEQLFNVDEYVERRKKELQDE